MPHLPFTFGKCKTRAGYSARLLKQEKIELSALAPAFEVTLQTPLLWVLQTTQGKVIVHRYGEIIFQEGKDVSKMEEIVEKIYQATLTKTRRSELSTS